MVSIMRGANHWFWVGRLSSFGPNTSVAFFVPYVLLRDGKSMFRRVTVQSGVNTAKKLRARTPQPPQTNQRQQLFGIASPQ